MAVRDKIYHLVGIGLGPANLSTAALLHKCAGTDVIFLEQKEKFSWHTNMMFDFSNINVGFYKDLVTLVDPTNPYSFMNYLVANNKQYSFFSSSFNRVSRAEFEQYFHWVAQSISYILFSCKIDQVEYQENKKLFIVESNKGTFLAKNILIGTGIIPKLPDWISDDEASVFHGYNYLSNKRSFNNENVLIVGGGQSSAEVIYSLLENDQSLPARIYWVTKKGYPVILDENPFANDIYTPAFAEFFYNLDVSKREELGKVLRDTSDGIHEALLTKIYQRLFFLNKTNRLSIKLSLFPLSKLHDLEKYSPSDVHTNAKYKAILNGLVNKSIDNIDRVIFCTGFTHKSSNLLRNLKNYYGDKIEIEKDFSIRKINNEENRIFVNNGAKSFYGPADPNLSLLPWRSAIIINSLLKENIYPLNNEEEMIYWGK